MWWQMWSGHCGGHIAICANTESLCCSPETKIMFYVNYTLIKTFKGKGKDEVGLIYRLDHITFMNFIQSSQNIYTCMIERNGKQFV